MRQLQELSGPWRGRWTQSASPFVGATTGIEKVNIEFGASSLEGVGEDCDGAFLFRGVHDGTRVEFQKLYIAARWDVAESLTYQGIWNGEFIGGEWRDDNDPEHENCGPFELWPLKLEEKLSLQELEGINDNSATPVLVRELESART
jgi:hypothetical protein